MEPSTMDNIDYGTLLDMASGVLQPQHLTKAFIDPRTRKDALIFVIAVSILRNIDVCNPGARLLPPVFGALARATASLTSTPNGKSFAVKYLLSSSTNTLFRT